MTDNERLYRKSPAHVIKAIEDLNYRFDYGDKMSDPLFWLDMLRQQGDEIQDHIENGDLEKAHDEFADCIFVAVKALMESDPRYDHWTQTVYHRSRDIVDRVDEVQDTYEGRWSERSLHTGSAQDGDLGEGNE